MNPKKSGKKKRKVGPWATVIVAVFAALPGYGLYFAADRSADAAQKQAEVAEAGRADMLAQAKLDAAARAMSFDQSNVPISRCASLSGRADTVPGWVLWVAQKGDEDQYYLRKPKHSEPDRWTVDRWTIGGASTPNGKYEISVLYFDDQTSSLIDSVHAHSTTDSRASWYLGSLPTSPKGNRSWVVQRDGVKGEKSCSGTA